MSDNKFTGQDYKDIGTVLLLAVILIGAPLYMYKVAGKIVLVSLLGVCAVFLPIFLAKPAVIYFSSKRAAKRMRPVNRKLELLRVVLLGGFFAGAAFFIFHTTGWMVFGVFLGFALLFSPLFLTKPGNIKQADDPYLDPVNKGLKGNIFTKK